MYFTVSRSLEHLVVMASSPVGKLKNQKEERYDHNPYVVISFGRLSSQLHVIYLRISGETTDSFEVILILESIK